MSEVTKILSSFEEELKSIIDSKEETEKSMRERDEILFARCGSKDPEQIRLHKLFQQQPKPIKAGINLKISSDKLADEVHKGICELVKEKSYKIEEEEWFRFKGTNTWHFGFTY